MAPGTRKASSEESSLVPGRGPSSGFGLSAQGIGAPLVYVPGIDGTGKLFFAQTPRLAHRYRVTTYRLRDSAETMSALVDDLSQVVRKSSPDGEPVTLVAESFGGALAMSYALQHPASVAALVVLNAFARFHAPWKLQVAIGGMRMLPWAITSRLRHLSARRHHSPSTPAADSAQALALARTATEAGYLGRLRMLARYDLRDRLPELSTPTLFLAADRDALIPSVPQAHFMASRVPNAQVRVLEGHRHACLLAPDIDVAGLLEEWQARRN